MAKHLRWLQTNQNTHLLNITFSVNHFSYGVVQEIELKPNGSKIEINDSTRGEYIRLYTRWLVLGRYELQLSSIDQGFWDVVPKESLETILPAHLGISKLLTYLELAISGIQTLNPTDWESCTRVVKNGQSTKVVGYFWKFVEGTSNEQRRKLLGFVTGTSSLPARGFAALQPKRYSSYFTNSRFTVNIVPESENLPSSHTCTNILELPAYTNYETLESKLLLAIEEQSFGFI